MPIDYLPSGRGGQERRNTSWSGKRRSFPNKIRLAILRRDPTCRWPGCNKPSEVADHIVPWSEAVRLGWELDEIDDVSNGQGLCNEHHDLKTREEQRRGRERVARKRRPERHPGMR